MATFLTVQTEATARFKEKMSEFISWIFPVTGVEQARELIKKVSNQYHDARHVCHAYVIGADRAVYNSSDNGEPSGTAGKPILGQINSYNLTNVLIVVVRYFGGVKLGKPGLIAAYRQSAQMAIQAARIIQYEEMTLLELSFPYESANEVMKIIKARGLKPQKQVMDSLCSLTLNIPLSLKAELEQTFGQVAKVNS